MSSGIFSSKDWMPENIIDRSVLTDGILALANYFKEHGFTPPISIEVDKLAFQKILAESAELYNIDSKKAITEHEFSISEV
ncbi:MAG: hypothetical protein QN720_04715, partial [Nitrososphaeraceae archaeon]|nr:hypothetical protein [Nitrososphaeraceae archaeon]MDW0332248.1 hypothetical protein [Nitrososphaeraceae archaeon]